jgi:hypothetical protein
LLITDFSFSGNTVSEASDCSYRRYYYEQGHLGIRAPAAERARERAGQIVCWRWLERRMDANSKLAIQNGKKAENT